MEVGVNEEPISREGSQIMMAACRGERTRQLVAQTGYCFSADAVALAAAVTGRDAHGIQYEQPQKFSCSAAIAFPPPAADRCQQLMLGRQQEVVEGAQSVNHQMFGRLTSFEYYLYYSTSSTTAVQIVLVLLSGTSSSIAPSIYLSVPDLRHNHRNQI
jgi:hypothetical protein